MYECPFTRAIFTLSPTRKGDRIHSAESSGSKTRGSNDFSPPSSSATTRSATRLPEELQRGATSALASPSLTIGSASALLSLVSKERRPQRASRERTAIRRRWRRLPPCLRGEPEKLWSVFPWGRRRRVVIQTQDTNTHHRGAQVSAETMC